MTIAEAIERLDRLTNNLYPTDDKVRWLNELDALIYRDVIARHESGGAVAEPRYLCCDTDAVLLVPEPYADELYLNYLQMKVAKENGEDARQNKAIVLYNEAYLRWARAYNEEHSPVHSSGGFRF